jgi:hypothetical protein
MTSTQQEAPASPGTSVPGRDGQDAAGKKPLNVVVSPKPRGFNLSPANAVPIRHFISRRRARAARRKYKLITSTGRLGCGAAPQLFRNAIINIMIENPIGQVTSDIQVRQEETTPAAQPDSSETHEEKTTSQEEDREKEDKILNPTPSEAASTPGELDKKYTEQEILDMLASEDEDDPYVFRDDPENQDDTHLDFYQEEEETQADASDKQKDKETDQPTMEDALTAMQGFLTELGEYLKPDTTPTSASESEEEGEIKNDPVASRISYLNIASFFKTKFEKTNLPRFQKLYLYYTKKAEVNQD